MATQLAGLPKRPSSPQKTLLVDELVDDPIFPLWLSPDYQAGAWGAEIAMEASEAEVMQLVEQFVAPVQAVAREKILQELDMQLRMVKPEVAGKIITKVAQALETIPRALWPQVLNLVDTLPIDSRPQALACLHSAWQKLNLDQASRKQIFNLIEPCLACLTLAGRAQVLESIVTEGKAQLDAIQFVMKCLPTLGSGTTMYQKVCAAVQHAIQTLPSDTKKPNLAFSKQKQSELLAI
ncbi:Cobaltochelatase, CobN subunit [Mycoavidus cysteinexigens]|uniref:Cobaltochelatase, CobN subunit n=1 Tax=Mycoavidus cysteinexigens TaxID=1553431 RepID=A0A2Z6EUL9_9BURK|nr:hypothetical protein [Mycoavidus cysteinexigens]BBE09121.1 Cobaltochelatase, CobN subunit [Mycoavidus cysteinexigens]GLR00215.1 hypothetical protein GCM10007934_00260 [Mycoavidus cysteinexigens]